jgi:hypothetical protein
MSSGKFYTMRSCNDDYVPLTCYTCEPSDLINKKYTNEETTTTQYPDPRLEAIDEKLEKICSDQEKILNGSEHDIMRPDFDDETQMILEYVEKNKFTNMSIAEATEYLKSCHHCGNTEIPFGDEYCNERCQDYSIVFDYPCFRGADCKACNNYYRHKTFIIKNYKEDVDEYIMYDDDDDDADDADDADCYPTMEEYYDSIDNNNNDNEELPTTTSHCSLCDSYVIKDTKYCEPCIKLHGAPEELIAVGYEYNQEYDLYEDFSVSDENNEYTTWDNDQAREDYEESLRRRAEEAQAYENEWGDQW